ncbi:hypothetical protein Tco_0643905 [Tanacetum coccineum]
MVANTYFWEDLSMEGHAFLKQRYPRLSALESEVKKTVTWLLKTVTENLLSFRVLLECRERRGVGTQIQLRI